jgi:uncharacterized membrane protein YeaQ/YmgE (transglycosylase-associated protein family)
MRFSRITKIAGLTLAGFVAASVAADKANVGPLVAQVAGFAGAFVGTLVAQRRTNQSKEHEKDDPGSQPMEKNSPPKI